MKRASVLAVLITLCLSSAYALDPGDLPVTFHGSATALTGAGQIIGSTGDQIRAHPYSVTSPRAPFVIAGALDARILTARAEAGRPGGTRTQTASSEAADVTVLPGSPFAVHAVLARGDATASCANGVVTSSGDADVRGVSVGDQSLPVEHYAPNTVLFDQGGITIVGNEQSAAPDNGIIVTALHIYGLPIGDVFIGGALAAIPVCPDDETWGRAPDAPFGLQTDDSGSGEGSFTRSLPCSEGAHGSYYHFDYTSPVDAADDNPASHALAGHLHAALDMHLTDTSGEKRQNAFLLGNESRLVLHTPRGTITAELTSGDCDEPTLTFIGSRFFGGGSWRIVDSTGSFREARGAGTFTMNAVVGPGPDNVLAMLIDGFASVLMPRLGVAVRDATTSPQGFVAQRSNFFLDVGNDGPGDAFETALTSLTPSIPGVVFEQPSVPFTFGELDIFERGSTALRALLSPLACDPTGCALPFGVELDTLTALNQPVHQHAFETIVVPGGPS